MRRALAPVVVALLIASCAGGSDAAPLTTVPAAVTDPPPATEPSPTVSVETTIPTTQAPTTTIDEAAAEIAAVEQAAIDAYNAYHAAILDPSNPGLRADIEATHAGPALEFVVGVLDDLVALRQEARPHPELRPTAEVTGSVRFTLDDRSRADLLLCELNPEKFVEVGGLLYGGDSFVRDDVFVLQTLVETKRSAEGWKVTGGEVLSTKVGDVPCE